MVAPQEQNSASKKKRLREEDSASPSSFSVTDTNSKPEEATMQSATAPSPMQFLLDAAQGLQALSQKSNNAGAAASTVASTAIVSAESISRENLAGSSSSSFSSEEEEEKRPKKKARRSSTSSATVSSLSDHESSSSRSKCKSSLQQKRFAAKHDIKWMQRYKELQTYYETHGNCLVPQKEPETKALGSWVMNQRKQYKLLKNNEASSMTQVRLELLESINFEFDPHGNQWKKRYQELQTYRQEFGDCMVPYKYDPNPQLGLWVDKQRRQYRCYQKGQASFMSADRVKSLEQLDFCWEPLETISQAKTAVAVAAQSKRKSPVTIPPKQPATVVYMENASWVERYSQLEDYHTKYGDCLVPVIYPQNPSLASWVKEQREQYKIFQQNKTSKNKAKIELTGERIFMLEKLDFDWDPCQSSWMDRFQELVQYHKTHGNINVPKGQGYSKLAEWLVKQRAQYKRFKEQRPSNISHERIHMLEELGMEWGAFDSLWMTRYQGLVEYHRQQGHCHVPSNDAQNPELARWCDTQRKQWKLFQQGKPSSLSPDRVQLLQQIGFDWEPLESLWLDSLRQLEEYQREHGDCNVPKKYEPNPELGRWIDKQRQQYKLFQEGKHSHMTTRRIGMLEGLGFDWNPHETAWMTRFDQVSQHLRRHGTLPTRRDNASLYQWIYVNRRNYQKHLDSRKGKGGPDPASPSSSLTQERLALLESLGPLFCGPTPSPVIRHHHHHHVLPLPPPPAQHMMGVTPPSHGHPMVWAPPPPHQYRPAGAWGAPIHHRMPYYGNPPPPQAGPPQHWHRAAA